MVRDWYPSRRLLLSAVAILLLVSGRSSAFDATEGIVVNDRSSAYVIASDDAAPVLLASTPTEFLDIAVSPTGELFGTASRLLRRLDNISGSWVVVGSHGKELNAMEFGPDGVLYAAGGNVLYTLDVTNGRATTIGSVSNLSSSGDLVVTCDRKVLVTSRTSEPTDALFEIDLVSRRARRVGSLGFPSMFGLSLSGGRLVGFSSKSGAAVQMIEIDPRNAKSTVLQVFPASDLATVRGASSLGERDSSPALYGIEPEAGSNAGFVTVSLRGESLPSAPAEVRLVAPGAPILRAVSYGAAGCSQVGATFDLRNAPPGPRTVEVLWSDGTSLSLPHGFEIRSGAGSDVRVSLVTPPRYRRGGSLTVELTVTNHGDADAYGVPIFVEGIPPDAVAEVIPKVVALDGAATPPVPALVQDDQSQLAGLIVPHLPPGAQRTIVIRTKGSEQQEVSLQAWSLPPLLEPSVPADPGGKIRLKIKQDFLCLKVFVDNTIFDLLPDALSPEKIDCIYGNLDRFVDYVAELPETFASGGTQGALWSYGDFVQGTLVDCLDPDDLAPGFFKKLLNLATWVDIGRDVVDKCGPLFQPWTDPLVAYVQGVASLDPNDKLAPVGGGADHWIGASDPVPYVVRFENVATASAPAAEIRIEDVIDPDQFDLETFRFGDVRFGASRVVASSAADDRFAAAVDLRPAQAVIAQISGVIDRSTGLVTWALSGRDPASGQPIDDPLVGILPPNRVPPEGEGSVSFTVKARRDLETGSTISNRARIFFDANSPIDTPVVTNRIDGRAPVSGVVAVKPHRTRELLKITWDATDDGAGVASGELWARENGGAFEHRISGSIGRLVLPAHYGSSYEFFSLGRDAAGNLEPLKSQAEASFAFGVTIQKLRREYSQLVRAGSIPGAGLQARLLQALVDARSYERQDCLRSARKVMRKQFIAPIERARSGMIETPAAERLLLLAKVFTTVPATVDPDVCAPMPTPSGPAAIDAAAD